MASVKDPLDWVDGHRVHCRTAKLRRRGAGEPGGSTWSGDGHEHPRKFANYSFEDIARAGSDAGDNLPLTGVSVDFERVPLTGRTPQADVADGVSFWPGLENDQVTMFAHAQVVKTVLLDAAFEGKDDEGVFAELRHGSGGDSSGADERAGEFPIERVSLESIPIADERQHLLAQIGDAVERTVA